MNLLGEVFPESRHVRGLGLMGAADSRIWDHARDNGFVIVSKDNDFRQRSFVLGAPPKIVWLQIGNAATLEIEALLRTERARMESFMLDPESSLLVLALLSAD